MVEDGQSARCRRGILLQVAGIMLLLILIAAIRAHSEFDASNATWLLLAGFALTTAALVGYYVRMESQRLLRER